MLVVTTRPTDEECAKEDSCNQENLRPLQKGRSGSVVQFEAVHNFNQQSREAVYRFFAQVNPDVSDPKELAEHDVEVPMLQEMMRSPIELFRNAVDLNDYSKSARDGGGAKCAAAGQAVPARATHADAAVEIQTT